MTDYSHIPIHIRCTERWKIDPDYPQDSSRWWVGQAQVMRGDGTKRPSESTVRRQHEEMTPAEIKRDVWLQRQS